MTKKEAEKVIKYKDLTTEIQRMWNTGTEVIPVITGATVTISVSLRQYPSNISGRREIMDLQRQPYWALHTYCGTYKCTSTKHFNVGDNITCSTDCKYRTATTLYTLETRFVSGI
jgi:hypothetical protein